MEHHIGPVTVENEDGEAEIVPTCLRCGATTDLDGECAAEGM